MYRAMTQSTNLPTGVTEVVYMNNVLSNMGTGQAQQLGSQDVVYVSLRFQFLLAQAISTSKPA